MSASIVGQRRSFDGHLCTIRYVGTVQGTTGDWLGVEWDDAIRGKHSGEHKGIRYFSCKSNKPTAGSFVRPSRPSDQPRSFLEALREKYASEFEDLSCLNISEASRKKAIQISGKVVEEVGFDKIRKQLAELKELRIVLLDGLLIAGVLPSYDQVQDQDAAQKIAETCPKIIELDLSRSLLSRWRDVWEICNQLKHLKRLKLNGNRFQALNDLIFEGVTELHLEDTLLNWDEIAAVASQFPGLTSLTASANQLSEITRPLPNTITTLTLEHNEFTSISALRHLAALPNLEHLSVRGSAIDTVNNDTTPLDFQFPQTLRSLDLSRNKITSWTFLNQLPTLFPGLTTLRISDNPLFDQPTLPQTITATEPSKPMTLDEAFMLTLSRFPSSLTTLNYSIIKPTDRSNAEMYYLSLIGKELSATSEAEEPAILSTHPRYSELCELYTEPTITRAVISSSGSRVIHPRSVAARLVKMAFRLSKNKEDISEVRVKEIPGSFDTYQVKALVSRLFGLPAFGFKLVWQTDEWDPVEKENVEAVDWDDSEDEALDEQDIVLPKHGGPDSGFVRREVELVDSTRDIGFLFQGEEGEVRVRVEVPFESTFTS
ncbi:hypothetical protein PENANT_c005G06601 [Penicillium antarcticum]|uniref:CAP-Gly domain-containing protein n=1 Tax=Penicillium antarcticum TaxID=416450 RepID=A0A1V6QEZ8_9EURO|nr:uncharacterized protein N7508_007920 [Penicillium antarcticum]KAJ5297671.1 hypothetical protein N7508_007920 [Penicillium antarcticum]OQD87798.1 hypothetical protein PENANT_c005G06601 [Penicillium antarcticum]